MVFFNKQLLKSNQLELDAPFFVSFVQCLVSVNVCFVALQLSKLKFIKHFPSLGYDFFCINDNIS